MYNVSFLQIAMLYSESLLLSSAISYLLVYFVKLIIKDRIFNRIKYYILALLTILLVHPVFEACCKIIEYINQ